MAIPLAPMIGGSAASPQTPHQKITIHAFNCLAAEQHAKQHGKPGRQQVAGTPSTIRSCEPAKLVFKRHKQARCACHYLLEQPLALSDSYLAIQHNIAQACCREQNGMQMICQWLRFGG
jgi:hypothetical protein